MGWRHRRKIFLIIYVTKVARFDKEISDRPAQVGMDAVPSEEDIQVTPEMIEAGADALNVAFRYADRPLGLDEEDLRAASRSCFVAMVKSWALRKDSISAAN